MTGITTGGSPGASPGRTGRPGRVLLGAIGGILWGSGAAVLVQQYGWWPLDLALTYGAPLAAAIGSGWWGGHGSRRIRGAALAVLLAASPLLMAQQVCEAEVATSSGSATLAETSPSDPFVLDPAVDRSISVEVTGDFVDAHGEIWIDVAGLHLFSHDDVVTGSLSNTFDFDDFSFLETDAVPGIYRVRGTIDGSAPSTATSSSRAIL